MAGGLTARYKDLVAKASDFRLNKSGTIGTEPIAKPNGSGGYDRGVDLKFGGLGSVFVPTQKIKNGVKQVGRAAKAVGDLGVAVATEPFTGKILKENNDAIDARLTAQNAALAKRKQAMAASYSSNK